MIIRLTDLQTQTLAAVAGYIEAHGCGPRLGQLHALMGGKKSEHPTKWSSVLRLLRKAGAIEWTAGDYESIRLTSRGRTLMTGQSVREDDHAPESDPPPPSSVAPDSGPDSDYSDHDDEPESGPISSDDGPYQDDETDDYDMPPPAVRVPPVIPEVDRTLPSLGVIAPGAPDSSPTLYDAVTASPRSRPQPLDHADLNCLEQRLLDELEAIRMVRAIAARHRT